MESVGGVGDSEGQWVSMGNSGESLRDSEGQWESDGEQ